MQKLLITLLVAFFISASLLAQPAMQQKTIANNRVTIDLPSDFIYLETEKSSGKALLADKTGKATLAYQLMTDSITDNDINSFADDQLKLGKQDDESFKYIDDGIHLQDGKNIGYLKFSTKENGKKYFNYTFFISVDDKPLIFKFSCPLKQQKKWEQLVDVIANSIRIKV